MIIDKITYLDPDSQKCVRYIADNVCVKDIKLSKRTEDLAQGVYQIISKTYVTKDNTPHLTNKGVVEWDRSIEDNPDKDPDSFYLNPFVSSDVKNLMEKTAFVNKMYSLNGITVNMYTKQSSQDYNITSIFHICRFMLLLASKPNTPITINILYTDLKKSLDPTITKLSPVNVNSGSTIKNVTVSLWRKEELAKVLIHELVHYLSMDLLGVLPEGIYPVKGKVLLNEGYTELITVFIHTVYVVYLLYKDQILDLNKFKDAISYEINWSSFQIAKLMRHFKMSNIQEYHKIVQDTSVFSYYFVKGCLLLYLMDKDIGDYFYTDKPKEWRAKWYISSIKKALEHKICSTCVDFYLNKVNQDEFINRSMRMTCLQIA